LSALTKREWVAVFLIGGLIAAIIASSLIKEIKIKKNFHRTNFYQQHTQDESKIYLTLLGAVENPGTYAFTPGLSLREILKEVSLSKQADRKKIDLKKIIYHSETIEIPFKSFDSQTSKQKKIEEKR